MLGRSWVTRFRMSSAIFLCIKAANYEPSYLKYKRNMYANSQRYIEHLQLFSYGSFECHILVTKARIYVTYYAAPVDKEEQHDCF